MIKNKILTVFFAFLFFCINSVVYATDTEAKETKDKTDSDVVETTAETSSKTEEESTDKEETTTEEETEEDDEPDCD